MKLIQGGLDKPAPKKREPKLRAATRAQCKMIAYIWGTDEYLHIVHRSDGTPDITDSTLAVLFRRGWIRPAAGSNVLDLERRRTMQRYVVSKDGLLILEKYLAELRDYGREA